MKIIAVLTDLSKSAEHATQFALHMAKKIKAKVLLFQINEVPVIKQLTIAGLQDDCCENKSLLTEYSARMSQVLTARTLEGGYLPEIAINDESTEIVDVMTTIMQSEDICMIVMPSGTEYDLTTYLLTDACNRIIDWARVPVMIVPETAPLHNFEKIAFASQLHHEDINAIAELGALLESFAAELMVAHLNANPTDAVTRQKEEQLNHDLYRKLNCGGVYFRSIPDMAYEKNWDWLKANKKTELLAVVQQPREQMTKFFNRGRNGSVTYHLTLPVIVLPKRP